MSLRYALLGFLNYKSLNGYEIKQFFDNSISHFWNANLSQIYPALAEMKDEGLLEMELKYNENTPNSKIYHITDKGRQQLKVWLKENPAPPSFKDAFLIKVFFGSFIDKQDITRHLEKQLAIHSNNLSSYKEQAAQMKENLCNPDLNTALPFWSFTLNAGIKLEEAYVDWCKETLEKVKI